MRKKDSHITNRIKEEIRTIDPTAQIILFG
jgi:hypothetical protein